MKSIWILLIVFIIFISYGIVQTNYYNGIIYAPPGAEAPIELLYGAPGNLVSAPRVIFNSERKTGEFRYEFSIPNGNYPVLLIITHGSTPSSELLFQNAFRATVLEIQNPVCIANRAGIVQAHNQSGIMLPTGSLVQLLSWMVRMVWSYLALVALICFSREFLIRLPLLRHLKSALLRLQCLFNISPLRSAVLLMALLGLLCLVPGAIRYDVGDDPAMEMLASGYVTGHPSEYLIFVHFLPGLILKALYSFCPFFPWYPILLMLVTLTGISIIIYSLQRHKATNDRSLWIFLFLTSCVTNLATHLQFTSTAFILGFGGILFFILYTSTISIVLSLILVISCSLLRYESFILLAGTFSWAAFYFTRRSLNVKILYGLTIIIFAQGLKEINLIYYLHDPGWRSYLVYNQARGELHQTPKLNDNPDNDSVFKAVGWSVNDREMFDRYWLFQDSHVYSVEKLKYLATHLAPDRDLKGCFFALLIPIIRLPGVVLFIVMVIGLGAENDRFFWKKIAVILAPSLILFGYLALYAHLPDRVVLPTLCGCGALLLIYLSPTIQRLRSPIHFFHMILLIALMLSLSFSTIAFTCKQRIMISEQLHNSLDRLKSIRGKTFVSSINSVRLEDLGPFDNFSLTSGFDIIHLLWSFESPSYNLQLQHHNSHALFLSIAHDPHFLLLVPTEEMERGQAFSTFMLEHYGETIHMKPFKLPDGTLAIFPDFTVLQSSTD